MKNIIIFAIRFNGRFTEWPGSPDSYRDKTVSLLLRLTADTEGKDGGSNRLNGVKEFASHAKQDEQPTERSEGAREVLAEQSATDEMFG